MKSKTQQLKGMTFDHDFGYFFPFFSSFLKKEEEEKENELAKIVVKTYAFQPGPTRCPLYKNPEVSLL